MEKGVFVAKHIYDDQQTVNGAMIEAAKKTQFGIGTFALPLQICVIIVSALLSFHSLANSIYVYILGQRIHFALVALGSTFPLFILSMMLCIKNRYNHHLALAGFHFAFLYFIAAPLLVFPFALLFIFS